MSEGKIIRYNKNGHCAGHVGAGGINPIKPTIAELAEHWDLDKIMALLAAKLKMEDEMLAVVKVEANEALPHLLFNVINDDGLINKENAIIVYGGGGCSN